MNPDCRRAVILAVILCVPVWLLSGCSLPNLTPPPPATPAVSDIITQQAALKGFTGAPTDFVNLGAGLSNSWCTAYLNQITQTAAGLDFAANSATQLGALGSGIAGVAGGSIVASTVIGLLFPAINQTLIAEGRLATAGADPGVVYGLILKEQSAFLGALTVPASLSEAVMDITSYAAMCQPAGIRSAVMQAGINASVSASSGGGVPVSSGLRATAPLPFIHHPPIVVVGAPPAPIVFMPPSQSAQTLPADNNPPNPQTKPLLTVPPHAPLVAPISPRINK